MTRHALYIELLIALSAGVVIGQEKIGPVLTPPNAVNVLSSERPLKKKWARSYGVLFWQAITNFPTQDRVSWLVGLNMGNDGVFLHTRVGIVCESTIIQKWEADPEGDDATSSPLNGYYDYGQLIRFATNQIAVCLEKLPQRGGAGVDVYLLGTNSGPVVFECRSDGQTERNFFFTDVNGDGIGEIVQKEVRSGSSAITIWDWRAESRVFVQRKIKEPSLNWDRLLKINTNAVVF